jgi:branched-chain amino acid transport system permease protein
VNSQIGHRFVVLRTNEELAAAIGIVGYRTKVFAVVVSSIPAAFGGVYYAYSQQFVGPGTVSLDLAIFLLAGCVIGGMGTVMGPVIGGIAIFALTQFLGIANQWEGLVLGVLLILFATFLPIGVMGLLQRAGEGFATRRQPVRLGALMTQHSPGHGPQPDGLQAQLNGHGPVDRSYRPKQVWPSEIPGSEVTAEGSSTSRLKMGADEPLILRHVCRHFGGVKAVDDVSLTVVPGSVHALVGSNGSGKTTLLNLTSGFYRSDSGEILLGEARLDGLPAHMFARLGVVRTFQTPRVMPEFSVLENIVPATELHGGVADLWSMLHLPSGRRAKKASLAQAAEALEMVELSAVANSLVGTLPHGVQRLVEVARIAALRPKYVLLDEPAAGLSDAEEEILTRAILALREAQVGVLLVEHNIPFILNLMDFTTVMHQGKCIAQGEGDSALHDPQVVSVFLGKDISEHSERAQA